MIDYMIKITTDIVSSERELAWRYAICEYHAKLLGLPGSGYAPMPLKRNISIWRQL